MAADLLLPAMGRAWDGAVASGRSLSSCGAIPEVTVFCWSDPRPVTLSPQCFLSRQSLFSLTHVSHGTWIAGRTLSTSALDAGDVGSDLLAAVFSVHPEL